MAIDQERFLKCRSEFLQSLKIHNISNDDAMLLCASALNECLAGTQYSVSIKALELCVHAMSEFMAEEHFTVTVQLHDKVELTGSTWLPE